MRRCAAVLLGAALLLPGCSRDGASQAAAATASATAASASPSVSGTRPAAGPTTSPASPASPSPGSLSPVPSRSRRTLPAVRPSATVAVGAKARAVLVGSRNVTVTGRGPGELSGPGIALTLQVTNPAAAPLDLDVVTVSASVRGQEASASAATPSKPLSGRLAPGGRATGVYVFVLPAGARRPVAVVVSLSPELPVATFTVP
jgi:hypothetical protein